MDVDTSNGWILGYLRENSGRILGKGSTILSDQRMPKVDFRSFLCQAPWPWNTARFVSLAWSGGREGAHLCAQVQPILQMNPKFTEEGGSRLGKRRPQIRERLSGQPRERGSAHRKSWAWAFSRREPGRLYWQEGSRAQGHLCSPHLLRRFLRSHSPQGKWA